MPSTLREADFPYGLGDSTQGDSAHRTGFIAITANGLYCGNHRVFKEILSGDGEALLARDRGETDLLQSSLAKSIWGDPILCLVDSRINSGILDQPQRTLPEDLFSRSEIALISAENTSRQRICTWLSRQCSSK